MKHAFHFSRLLLEEIATQNCCNNCCVATDVKDLECRGQCKGDQV